MVVPRTRIEVRVSDTEAHCLDLLVRTEDLLEGSHEFFMPVWTPGSYLVREFARYVTDVEARRADGGELPLRKVRKNRWAVDLDAPGTIELRYRVYCHDLTVRTNYVDERRAYWNGAATYLLSVERMDALHEVSVVLDGARAGWTAHSGLALEEGRFVATTYDELIDCPFYCGDAPITEFDALGVPHRLILDGVPEERHASLTEETEQIVLAAAGLFGGRFPYESYLFVHFADLGGSGGLEHANSTILHVPRVFYGDGEERDRLLTLVAHEHFHSWNVKRIRPEGLAPFDYENENYTPDLWLAEGFTSYFQELIPYHARIFDRERFLERLAKTFDGVFQIPGRQRQSIAESSFDAWIKLYRADEFNRNSTVSYYSKGALAAFCFDALIQQHSKGERSLVDAMRELFADFEAKGPGQSRATVLAALSRAAGEDLTEAFEFLIDGREDPPLNEWLAPFGLRYEAPAEKPEAFLGIASKEEGPRLLVSTVDRGGPAESIGLTPQDEILAIDGERVLPSQFSSHVTKRLAPGASCRITVARRGLLMDLEGKLGARATGKPRFAEEKGSLVFAPLAD